MSTAVARPHLGLDRRWWTLIAVCGGTFVLLVDVTIVQVALPTIQHRLGASFTDLQWVIDAYALTLAAFILACGSLSDRFGRKRVFIAGVLGFTVASLLCGAATSAGFLVAARALQGFGGAAMFATGLALIGQEFHGPERGKAIAAWGATVGVAVAVGPLMGGGLIEGLGWRWIFFVNAPVGVLTALIAWSQMVNAGDPAATRLDFAGLGTFSASLFLLMFGLLRANAEGWGSPLIVSVLVGAALLMAAFIAVEVRHERPMFDLTLFRKPSFTGVSIATFAIGSGLFAMFPFITFYLQNYLGNSPLGGGLRMLPLTVPSFALPLMARRVSERLPARLALSSGLGLAALGLALMHGLSVRSHWTAIIPGLLLAGVAIGIANPAIARIALGVVPPQRSGMASGISNTCRLGGLSAGVAALGALFQHGIASSLRSQLGHPAAALAAGIASGGVRPAGASRQAFIAGTNEILLVGACVALAGALAGLTLVRSRDFHIVAVPASAPGEPRRETAAQA